MPSYMIPKPSTSIWLTSSAAANKINQRGDNIIELSELIFTKYPAKRATPAAMISDLCLLKSINCVTSMDI